MGTKSDSLEPVTRVTIHENAVPVKEGAGRRSTYAVRHGYPEPKCCNASTASAEPKKKRSQEAGEPERHGGRRARLVVRGPIIEGETVRDGSGGITPSDVDPGAVGRVIDRQGGQVRSPVESGRGAGVRRPIKAPADGNPSHVPPFHREIRKALVKVLVQPRVVEAGSAGAVPDGLEVVSRDRGAPPWRVTGAEQVDG
jgi:hypothetical protein